MIYRRHPLTYGRYSGYSPGTRENADTEDKIKNADEKLEENRITIADEIPLPVEPERIDEPVPDELSGPRSSAFSILGKKIHIEDIILFGIIFLLLDEGIEDELMLLLLIYVFIDLKKFSFKHK